MPILTKRTRASTLQIVSALLSKNDTRITFALGYFFSSTHINLVSLMTQMVWRLSLSVFVHDRYSHAGNCTGLPSNTALFLFGGNIYLFLFQRHLNPLRLLVIKVSDPDFSPPKHGFELIRLTYSQFVQAFQDIIGWIFWHRPQNFGPSCIEFLHIIVTTSYVEQIDAIQYCIMSASHSKEVKDHEGDLSSS